MGKHFPDRPQLMEFSEEVKSPPPDLYPVSIPIHVAWENRKGDKCAATAKTVLVNRQGATIVFQQKLEPTQEITVNSVGRGSKTRATVVGLIGQEPEGQVYGILLLDPAASPWNAELELLTQLHVPDAEYFLECAACLTRSQFRLNSIQDKVFEARRVITLRYPECDKWTVWGLASSAARSTPDHPEAAPKDTSKPPARAENRRKHGRISTNLTACVRSAGGPLDEVVRVKDVSRGGFRFQSRNYYPDGSRLLVAMPFTRNASNVFVPARVMWRKEVPRLKRYEYGVAYGVPAERSSPK